jgi:hypothetical protein
MKSMCYLTGSRSISIGLTIYIRCIINILQNDSVPAPSQFMLYSILLTTSRLLDQSGHHGLFRWSISVDFFSLPSKATDSPICPLTSLFLILLDTPSWSRSSSSLVPIRNCAIFGSWEKSRAEFEYSTQRSLHNVWCSLSVTSPVF